MQVLERARKAEAELVTLKAQLKSETATTKKSLKDMETALAESTALSSKSEREYITLRDSVKVMKESWAADVAKLKEEMRRREERWHAEAEAVSKKHMKMLEEAAARKKDVQSVEELRGSHERVRKEVEDEFRGEIRALRDVVERSASENAKAGKTAECVVLLPSLFDRLRLYNRFLAGELARLRRLMQSAGGASPPLED